MKKLELRTIAPANATRAALDGVARFDIPNGPLFVARHPHGATREEIEGFKRQLDALGGTTLLLPPGWKFEVLVPDAGPESAGPRSCPSCNAPLTVEGACDLCAPGGAR